MTFLLNLAAPLGLLNATHLISTGGLVLLGLFLFAEVGLFLGFFLPGDTLLLAAGIYAHEGKLPLLGVILVGIAAAIIGDSTSYWIGRKLGRRVFTKQESLLFKPEYVLRAEKFYEKWGTKAVSIAHFVPVVRTFTPLIGGVAKMPYKLFLAFDAIGDSAWALALSLLGYFVASHIPNIDSYVLYAVALVIICSAGPTLFQIVRYQLKKRPEKT